jgi:hypothetical protein
MVNDFAIHTITGVRLGCLYAMLQALLGINELYIIYTVHFNN